MSNEIIEFTKKIIKKSFNDNCKKTNNKKTKRIFIDYCQVCNSEEYKYIKKSNSYKCNNCNFYITVEEIERISLDDLITKESILIRINNFKERRK